MSATFSPKQLESNTISLELSGGRLRPNSNTINRSRRYSVSYDGRVYGDIQREKDKGSMEQESLYPPHTSPHRRSRMGTPSMDARHDITHQKISSGYNVQDPEQASKMSTSMIEERGNPGNPYIPQDVAIKLLKEYVRSLKDFSSLLKIGQHTETVDSSTSPLQSPSSAETSLEMTGSRSTGTFPIQSNRIDSIPQPTSLSKKNEPFRFHWKSAQPRDTTMFGSGSRNRMGSSQSQYSGLNSSSNPQRDFSEYQDGSGSSTPINVYSGGIEPTPIPRSSYRPEANSLRRERFSPRKMDTTPIDDSMNGVANTTSKQSNSPNPPLASPVSKYQKSEVSFSRPFTQLLWPAGQESDEVEDSSKVHRSAYGAHTSPSQSGLTVEPPATKYAMDSHPPGGWQPPGNRFDSNRPGTIASAIPSASTLKSTRPPPNGLVHQHKVRPIPSLRLSGGLNPVSAGSRVWRTIGLREKSSTGVTGSAGVEQSRNEEIDDEDASSVLSQNSSLGSTNSARTFSSIHSSVPNRMYTSSMDRFSEPPLMANQVTAGRFATPSEIRRSDARSGLNSRWVHLDRARFPNTIRKGSDRADSPMAISRSFDGPKSMATIDQSEQSNPHKPDSVWLNSTLIGSDSASPSIPLNSSVMSPSNAGCDSPSFTGHYEPQRISPQIAMDHYRIPPKGLEFRRSTLAVVSGISASSASSPDGIFGSESHRPFSTYVPTLGRPKTGVSSQIGTRPTSTPWIKDRSIYRDARRPLSVNVEQPTGWSSKPPLNPDVMNQYYREDATTQTDHRSPDCITLTGSDPSPDTIDLSPPNYWSPVNSGEQNDAPHANGIQTWPLSLQSVVKSTDNVPRSERLETVSHEMESRDNISSYGIMLGHSTDSPLVPTLHPKPVPPSALAHPLTRRYSLRTTKFDHCDSPGVFSDNRLSLLRPQRSHKGSQLNNNNNNQFDTPRCRSVHFSTDVLVAHTGTGPEPVMMISSAPLKAPAPVDNEFSVAFGANPRLINSVGNRRSGPSVRYLSEHISNYAN